MIVGGGYAASVAARKAASASPENGMAQHSPQRRDGAGQRHDAPGHTGGKAQLLAFHHIEGAIERNDDLAFVVEGITGRAFAVCIAIRRGGRLPLPQP